MANYLFGYVGRIESNGAIDLDGRAVAYKKNGFCAKFARVPRHIPNFISLGRGCGGAPRVIMSFIGRLRVPGTSGTCLRFTHVSGVPSFSRIRNILFLPAPSVLSKLTA